MKISSKNIEKLNKLISKFGSDVKELGGSVEVEYDNNGQMMLYMGLFAGPKNDLRTDPVEGNE
jgi:hypothetical protein